MRVYLTSLGCRLNQSELEMLARRFARAGHYVVAHPGSAHVCVVNSCTVTHVAARKSRQLIRGLHRANPQAAIIVTGCYAEMSPKAVEDIEGVELIVGNAAKGQLVEAAEQLVVADPRMMGAEPASIRRELAASGRTRALVKIQDGCSNQCAYCVVTLARGQEWSRPPEEVLSDVDDRVAAGYREVVLTGVNIGAYGRQGDVDLGGLVQRILDDTDLARLRLSSIEPWEMQDGWLPLWEDDRLCRHLHLPLQSGCDATLRRMGRRYRAAEYRTLVDRARASIPGLAVTTDLITGFPGETEEEFAQSRDFVRRMGFARLHVFPYSQRPGTPAAYFPDPVPHPVIAQRARCLRAIGEKAHQSFHRQFIGQTLRVLWEDERDGSGVVSGLTDNFLRAYTVSEGELRNHITPTYLIRPHAGGLWGVVMSHTGSDHSPESA
jgi:threonylcarbamoyladenosine tRNA methylthiotransferase MtaB